MKYDSADSGKNSHGDRGVGGGIVRISRSEIDREDHHAYAMSRQRERLFKAAEAALTHLTPEQLAQVVEMAASDESEKSNG